LAGIGFLWPSAFTNTLVTTPCISGLAPSTNSQPDEQTSRMALPTQNRGTVVTEYHVHLEGKAHDSNVNVIAKPYYVDLSRSGQKISL